jgi:hypothetical protein
MSETHGKLVCVTGASGFIGTHLVRELLARGHRVRGTVRDVEDQNKTRRLRELPGADERLELFSADLMKPGSFNAAVAGCEWVFHVASAVFLSAKDPQREIVLYLMPLLSYRITSPACPSPSRTGHAPAASTTPLSPHYHPCAGATIRRWPAVPDRCGSRS